MGRVRGQWRNLRDGGLAPGSVPAAVLEQIRIVNTATVAIIVIGLGALVQYITIGLLPMVLAVLAAVTIGIGNIVLLRATHEPWLAGHVAQLTLFALLVCSNLHSGGFYDPNFGWLYVLPLLGGVLNGFRVGWIWCGIVLVTTVAFWAAPQLGFPVPDAVPADLHAQQSLFNRLSAVLAVSVVGSAFVLANRRTQEELKRSA